MSDKDAMEVEPTIQVPAAPNNNTNQESMTVVNNATISSAQNPETPQLDARDMDHVKKEKNIAGISGTNGSIFSNSKPSDYCIYIYLQLQKQSIRENVVLNTF